ncbi:MAG: hypothetical protein JNL73_19085 [Anaerolineales bacterium]|nr:hypothetical protein [Anaerolineales bacterium]
MRRFWPLALGVSIVVAVLAPLLLTNLILARGDMFLYFYPYWDARAAALREWRLPLWTPDLFMGAPFLANPQTGVLYPLNWLVAPWNAPEAVKISLSLHALLAWVGTYLFARRRLTLAYPGSLLAATVFAIGGYYLAQAEHINQFQALAWFPWLLTAITARNRSAWQRSLLGALMIALQVLAGHTQSVVISGFGAAVVVVIESLAHDHGSWRSRGWRAGIALWPLGAAAVFAAVLTAAQLLPTFELQRLSLRSGGLEWRDAVSFSLDPRLLGLTLAPGYSRSLFTEFVGHVGLIALGLGALGALTSDRRRWPALGLVVLGLTFAMGAYNPIYAGLALVPPFNLFRVPARWLFLFAFGAALLAGLGLETWASADRRHRALASLGALGPILLIPLALGRTPPGETGPLALPALVDWGGWGLAWVAFVVLLWGPWDRGRVSGLALALCTLELGLSARALPLLATLTAPEAYTSARPALTQLLIDPARQTDSGPPPGRVLSMSALQFDPGDLGELRGLYAPQLSPAGLETLIVATKHKEVLSPNLSLTWGVPGVDGFDGGVLPTRAYADFTALFTGQVSSDGRLREHVTSAPDPRWLALVNARWLIADKTGDLWIEGVYYDRLFTRTLEAGGTARLVVEPSFPADALGVMATGPGRLAVILGTERAELAFESGQSQIALPFAPEAIDLIGPTTIEALSLIDTRTRAFQSVPLRPYRLAHSGDVKIYEVLDRLSRAFVVSAVEIVPVSAEALARLRDPGFDPERLVVIDSDLALESAVSRSPGSAVIRSYRPEHVELTATGPGVLVLTDAFYPGWRATIDAVPAEIATADGLFRAVALPAGEHTIAFTFAPDSVSVGFVVSVVGLLSWLMLWILPGSPVRRRRTPSTRPA